MSVPAGPPPVPSRPGPAPVRRPVDRTPPVRSAAPSPAPAPSAHVLALRESLRQVLAGLRFPARRWEVIAEADSWGVGGPLRQAIGRLPDGSYPSLGVVVEVLTAVRAAPDPGAAAPGRVVVPMRAPENGPRRTS